MSHTNINDNGTDIDIDRFEHYLKADPENSLLWINLADLYLQAGKADKATACYEKCLLLDPRNQVARSRLASQWIDQGLYREAESALRELLRQDPDNPALQHNLGVTLYAQQHWQEALAAFRQARQVGLEESTNLAYTVHCLHQSGATGEALETAKVWLEKSPGTATEGYIALLEMDHGNIATARERAERVLLEDPGNTDAATVLGNWCLEEQQIETATQHFHAIVAAKPRNPRGWLGAGLIYLYQQQYDAAADAFAQVLKLSPNHPGTLVTLGWTKFVQQDIQGAEASFRLAIDANHNFAEAHGGLACVLLFQHRNDEAEQEIKRAFRLERQNFGATFAKSLSLTLQGEGGRGQKILAELLLHPPQPGARPLVDNIRIFMQQQAPHEKDKTLEP